MKYKVLYILSTYNIYGGTPKKMLDLMKYFGSNSILYVYENSYSNFKSVFQETGSRVYEGYHGRNIYKHIYQLLKIIDKEEIKIVQTQFFFGEVLGSLIKLFRPKVKLIIAFQGSLEPNFFKKNISKILYRKIDQFVYISKYVKAEKERQFSILKFKPNQIIYNGSSMRIETNEDTIQLPSKSVLDISGLIEIKNIQILIKAFNLIVHDYKRLDYSLYVAGDGPFRKDLQRMIEEYHLQDHVFLLGYQKNVGKLLNSCNVFTHPCYAEGFGIVILEAMLAEKPIVVANAGALTETVEHGKSGLVVDPFNAEIWANAIMELVENVEYAKYLAKNAKEKAERDYSIEIFAKKYEKLYTSLL